MHAMPLRQLRNRRILPQRLQRHLERRIKLLADFVISLAPPVKQSRTLHTLTAGPKTGVHFNGLPRPNNAPDGPNVIVGLSVSPRGDSGDFETTQ